MPESPAPDIGSFLYLENHISLSLTGEARGSIREDPSQNDGERAKGTLRQLSFEWQENYYEREHYHKL